MFPLILNMECRTIVLAGEGQAVLRRLRQLQAAGAAPGVFAPMAEGELAEAAGKQLHRRWPEAEDMAGAVVFIAVRERACAEALTEKARQAATLVNVEDMADLCDFHVPALLRRGDLLFTVSTGGRAPGLAQALVEHLGKLFGPEWQARLERFAAARAEWRASGSALPELAKKARAMIGAEKWLSH